MHLLRIQVPDFRVLKDVDISFEKEFTPRIFPLGSQNGGGKSTLLQLIFVLLHCSGVPERLIFLRNMLKGFKPREGEDKKVLAIMDIWDGEKEVRMEFFSSRDASNMLNFLEKKPKFHSLKPHDIVEMKIFKSESEIEEQNKKNEGLSIVSENNQKYPILVYITKYSADEDEKEEKELLFCKIEHLDITQGESFLNRLSEKIFLAAPFTQVYLFLPQNVRKRLFIEKLPTGEDYYSELEKAKSALPGFFTYDFFPVTLIIESLKAARDQDTADLIKTGAYGNRFKPLLDDLNSVLTGKRLNVGTDLSKIIFEIHRDNQIVELYPEDMSHGELKRLSLYMWTKYHKIEDAIVLMDEIEIALHPDWQYQIVRDLMQWTPNNQYILATHSFDLCEALTPAHVKELEPKLLKRTSD
jgi:predicted ATPase